MEQKKQHHNGNGFLLGVIFGVVITLLFVTKKGRKMLRSLTEEGPEKFSELRSFLQEERQNIQEYGSSLEDNEDIAGDDYVEQPVENETKKRSSQAKRSNVAGRRFFRGVPKR